MIRVLAALALLGAMAQAQTPPADAGLEAALHNFPPAILGGNVQPVTTPGDPMPPPCPAAGGRVEQKGGPTIEFLGADPANPELCHLRMGADAVDAWFGIWVTTWPGADYAHRAIARVLHSRTGDAVGFDTVPAPGFAYHDIIRHDGLETINLLGNTYRSVSTLWIDTVTGLPIYATYQHIAGRPELDDPLIPTAIVPAH